ncbi:hypothetical protein [Thermococcus sp.]|uniref:hypothetical protein n=1 Tax=Thermococcus sp. TaxID=35749 RepID=UPI00260F44F0|nr:hypothetical protein [Thermococcus sp.]
MRYAGPKTGTGRPRKWDEPTEHISLRLPLSILQKIDEMTRPGVSRTDVIVALVESASNVQVAEYVLRNKELAEENEKLRKEIEELEKKLEDCASKLFDCKNNKPKLASKWSKILLAIPKAVEEGLTWNDLMRELNILAPQEQVKVMQQYFIMVDENGRIPEVIRPLPGIKELEGIVLYRPNNENVRFAKIVREDTLKAMKSLKVEAPKSTKEGQPAVEVPRAKIEKTLRKWLEDYEGWASDWRTKAKAEEFLKSVGNNGLKRLVLEYGFDVVAEVVGSNADYRALFGPFLLKLQEKKLEVKADV